MGGSGGIFGGGRPPEEIFKKVRDSEEKTHDAQFETAVASNFASLLRKYNQRSEKVQTHLEIIKKAIEKEIDGTVDIRFGGSVSKHTYVDGLSDVDALVILNKSELKDASPEEVKNYFLDRLSERLPKETPIEKGNLAITVTYSDIDVQLLPAIRYKGGFRIADSTGKNWSFIKSKEFTEALTKINKKSDGNLIPTIKLVKSINSCQAKNRQLESYHLEALALKVFRSYKGEKKTKEMLKYFFNNAGNYTKKPMLDKTGQSTHVDDYLGKTGSLNRKLIADTLSRIGRRIQNADRAHSEKQWEQILGGL
ncbi:MAG: nucleotidyltransferase [Planctomycetes bacterium]|nr:nucleotidyltransferase [Planctomycetota bacterium]